MRNRNGLVFLGGAMVVAGLAGGCPQRLFTVTQDFPLDDALAVFAVQANTPVQNRGTITITGDSAQVASAVLSIKPANIVVDTGGPGKGMVNAQDGTNVIVVQAAIADAAGVETVCDDGEQYGPFEVTLDANFQPVSVSPSSITLSQQTVSLLNSGAFSICLEVTSPVDGTITIQALTFELGL